MTERIAVFGATSMIAGAVIRRWAARRARLVLIGRNPSRLAVVAADARVRGAAAVEVLVAAPAYTPDALVTQAWAVYQGLDGVLLTQGWLPGSAVAETWDTQAGVLTINGWEVLQLLHALEGRFMRQRRGWLAVITSVAAVRGRSSLLAYGAAKALVSHWLSGLRQRFYQQGTAVRVVELRLGPVDTPMTQDLQPPLMVSPARVAEPLARACRRRNGVVYLPWFWRGIMTVLAHLPERLWCRLKF